MEGRGVRPVSRRWADADRTPRARRDQTGAGSDRHAR